MLGDKSQVLFVNDKAIISLVLHRGGEKKNSYSKDSNKDPPREAMELVGWKVFFFVVCFFSPFTGATQAPR